MATPQSCSATATQRVAPPCWSKEESLVLIEAYKEKWFALRCQNLKASDWGAVSAAVSSASGPETMKSSVQYRHKIEKLRQRFRAEKQRSLKNPGKFSSSWDLFPLLDCMNFVPLSVNGSADQDNLYYNKDGGFYWKLKNHENIYGNSGSDLGFDHCLSGGFSQGIDSVGLGKAPLKTLGDKSCMNLGFKPKNHGSSNLNYDYDNDLQEYVDEGMGFQAKVSDAWDSVPRGFHQKKCGVVDRSFNPGVDDYRGLNGFASCSSPELGVKNGNGGVKRGMDPVEEMVSSIKLLAEGTLKVFGTYPMKGFIEVITDARMA
ncbi:hypothetical protein GOBAR_AA22264 [Gossypium barbadense]|uniref:Myb/SANT-like DNA-binding domain-containing protein n=1 Tax=Gossypium barbadense TaxID=3634 RepID=A0A2P5X4Z2_GOSBA|nr:hypothetical protein GOBAR_AA22264 [Gossypium barbadense]